MPFASTSAFVTVDVDLVQIAPDQAPVVAEEAAPASTPCGRRVAPNLDDAVEHIRK